MNEIKQKLQGIIDSIPMLKQFGGIDNSAEKALNEALQELMKIIEDNQSDLISITKQRIFNDLTYK